MNDKGSFRRDFIKRLKHELPDLRFGEIEHDFLPFGADSANEFKLNLANSETRILSAESEESREEIFQAYVTGIRDMVSRAHAHAGPLALNEHKAAIFPHLVPPDYFEGVGENRPLCKSLPGLPLMLAYVVENPNSLRYILPADIEQSKMSEGELHALAMKNLRKPFEFDSIREKLRDKPDTVLVFANDAHEPARLLLLQEALNDNEALAVAVPDREALLVGKEPADWTEWRRLAKTPNGLPPLFDRPLRVTPHSIEIK